MFDRTQTGYMYSDPNDNQTPWRIATPMNGQSFARNSALILIPTAALLFAAAVPASAAEPASVSGTHSIQQSVASHSATAPDVSAMLADADARNAATDWVKQYHQFLPEGAKLDEIRLLQAGSRAAGSATGPEDFTSWQMVYSVRYTAPNGRVIMHSVAYNYNDGHMSFIDYIPSLFAGNLAETAPSMSFGDAYAHVQQFLTSHGNTGVVLNDAIYARPNGPTPNTIGYWYFTSTNDSQFVVNPTTGKVTPLHVLGR